MLKVQARILIPMIHRYLKSLTVFPLALLFFSCNIQKQGIFSKSRIEKDKADKETSLKPKLKHKVSADDKALNMPVVVTLPYKEASYFENTEIPVNGYLFSVKRGQQVRITVTPGSDSKKELYTQVWEKTGSEPKLIGSADAGPDTLAYDIEKDGQYIIRIEADKPEQTYTVMISTGPSLFFPINKSDKPRMSSFWGASRDNGTRSHEGIDIVAKKYTPVVAVADGYILSVKNGGLGGKTISLRPHNKDYSVYYAHLDQQFVTEGQQVFAGDTLGLVGNTGNAAKTVPHLHFGIYSMNGAIDPLAFIQENNEQPKEIKANQTNLRANARVKITTPLYSKPSTLTKKSLVSINDNITILAATDNFYRVRLDNGEEGYIPAANVNSVRPVNTIAKGKNK